MKKAAASMQPNGRGKKIRLLFLGWAASGLAVLALLTGGVKGPFRASAAPVSREMPLVIAHRAGAALGPENTLAALERAIGSGADMAEVDLRLTRDGEVVAVHDSSLERTAGLPQEVYATDLNTIRGLDAGSWYSERFAGERVPTLKELLDASRGRIRLMVELKYDGEDRGLLEETIRQIQVSGLTERCILACTRIDVLRRSKELEPRLDTVYIGEEIPRNGEGLDAADGLSICLAGLRAEEAAQVRGQGKDLYKWTVNARKEMELAFALGAEGLVTDNPALAQKVLEAGKEESA